MSTDEMQSHKGSEFSPHVYEDLDLLRRFEPICRFTKGEHYFPMAVDEFVARAALWLSPAKGEPTLLVPHGELNLDKLAEYDEIPPGHLLYLNLVDEPLSGSEYQAWRRRTNAGFDASGRLARVPLVFRLGDSLFDLSFFLRGQVPGGFAAAADKAQTQLKEADARCVYYGRVLRTGAWIVLHYNFYYTMNDWRSSFYGMNDHESDWEQVFVYVYEEASGDLRPRWVAYAAHNFSGDDLRRRWDDPLLDRVGEHPVVYTAAGSHASYFEAGEYLIGFTPPALKPVEKVLRTVDQFWRDTLGMGDPNRPALREESGPLLSIPFVDYARGDGLSIGPGQDAEWSPIMISDNVAWVDRYRGLWGLNIKDPTGSERPPAGPKYNRDGSVRQSWHDPLGWAGMHKEIPPDSLPQAIVERLAALQCELQEVDEEISKADGIAEDAWLDITALHHSEHNESLAAEEEVRLTAHLDMMAQLAERRLSVTEKMRALRSVAARAGRGEWVSPTAHLKNVEHPEPPLPPNRRIVDLWAAISGAITIVALILLIAFRPSGWIWFMLLAFVVLGAVEALTRWRLTPYLVNLTIILALVATGILVYEFWQWLLVGVVVALALYMIVDNLREIRR